MASGQWLIPEAVGVPCLWVGDWPLATPHWPVPFPPLDYRCGLMNEVVVRSSVAEPLGTYLSPVHLARTLWSHRELIRQFVGREILERHKGAYLGVAWNVLSPVLQLAVYSVIFGFVLKGHWERTFIDPRIDFTLLFLVGHTLFHFFAEVANRSPALVASRANLVRKVVFPTEIMPVVIVVSGLVYVGIMFALLVVVVGVVGKTFVWTSVFLPVVVVPLVMLALGTGWFLASLGVFVRDLRQVVPVLTMLLMFATPVFYAPERLPEELRFVAELNPLAVIVENGRRVMIWGEMPRWGALGAVTVLSAMVMQGGYAWYMKSKRGLADVL
jgi:lipopolysaccharide transport system permease protein